MPRGIPARVHILMPLTVSSSRYNIYSPFPYFSAIPSQVYARGILNCNSDLQFDYIYGVPLHLIYPVVVS